jgi:hypothetical protein
MKAGKLPVNELDHARLRGAGILIRRDDLITKSGEGGRFRIR